MRQLEDEPRATEVDLPTTIERPAISNGRLRLAYQEIVSANEELKTVNRQLQGKIAELETTKNDLLNLLASSEIATVCLDRELRIRWFTPSTRDLLDVIQTDVGRPISELGSPLAGESLLRDARGVLATLAPVQTEVRSEHDRWYMRRTLPYRTGDDRVDGVIATFSDITETRRAGERKLQAKEAMTDALEQRVEERTRQLRGLASELALAEERERRAVARDLHDDLGQVLNLARLKIDRLARTGAAASTRTGLAEIDDLIAQAHQSARSLTFQLSPPVLEELGLVPALQWLAEEMQHTYGLRVEVDVDDASEATQMSQATRSILFRAVRELLINAAKHALVDVAQVRFRKEADNVEITVSDAGVGFRPQSLTAAASPGLGLLNLRERLSYIGGAAQIQSEPGRGTVARLRAPLESGGNGGDRA